MKTKENTLKQLTKFTFFLSGKKKNPAFIGYKGTKKLFSLHHVRDGIAMYTDHLTNESEQITNVEVEIFLGELFKIVETNNI